MKEVRMRIDRSRSHLSSGRCRRKAQALNGERMRKRSCEVKTKCVSIQFCPIHIAVTVHVSVCDTFRCKNILSHSKDVPPCPCLPPIPPPTARAYHTVPTHVGKARRHSHSEHVDARHPAENSAAAHDRHIPPRLRMGCPHAHNSLPSSPLASHGRGHNSRIPGPWARRSTSRLCCYDDAGCCGRSSSTH